MKYVNFYPKTFHDIPRQDNPAFGPDECLMLVREEGSDRVEVLLNEDVLTKVAIFWREDLAVIFAGKLAEMPGKPWKRKEVTPK